MINDKDKLTNYLIIFFLIFFSTSYLLKLNYVIGIRDEIIYLSDSLLLLEGITPAHSYSPSGLSTWLGTLVVLIDFLINKFSISGIDILFNNFDLIISKHYQNLTYIKLSLFFFNIALLSYLFFIDKSKFFFLLFFILFLLPSFYEITFAGTPYFIASIFCSISIILKDRNKFLSIIFFALALSERIEFILLISFIANENNKFIFKNYLIVLTTFLIVSPWFIVSLLPNLKIIFKIFYVMPSVTIEHGIFVFLSKYFLFIFLIILSFYGFIGNKKVRIYSCALIVICISYFLLSETLTIRWFLPGFILIIFELSSYLKKNNFIVRNNNTHKLILTIICFILVFNFNNKNFISDHQILEKEIENNKSVIGVPLLIEKLNFNDYQKLFGKKLKENNIKNNNFFKNKDAPLVFGITGNLERRVNRRIQYLAKYNSNKFSNKYILGNSGLYWSAKKWCETLDKNTVLVFSDKENFNNCDDLN